MLHLTPEKIYLPAMRMMGLHQIQRAGDAAAIGAQWAAYNARPPLAGAVTHCWYGVMWGGQGDAMDYLCAQEVPHGAVPDGVYSIDLPAGNYAQFRARDTSIGAMWDAVKTYWYHHPDWPPRPAPMIEVYTADFDIAKGVDGFSILLPVV